MGSPTSIYRQIVDDLTKAIAPDVSGANYYQYLNTRPMGHCRQYDLC
jgi:hypothetical protein